MKFVEESYFERFTRPVGSLDAADAGCYVASGRFAPVSREMDAEIRIVVEIRVI